jgi:hypothetical protein
MCLLIIGQLPVWKWTVIFYEVYCKAGVYCVQQRNIQPNSLVIMWVQTYNLGQKLHNVTTWHVMRNTSHLLEVSPQAVLFKYTFSYLHKFQ